jgi:hypothetical protein
MLKIENVDVHGWEAAIRGMRNPKNSWEKSDSFRCYLDCSECGYKELCDGSGDISVEDTYMAGPNDRKLMMSLRNAGTDHRKFMRMIVVWLDITAPLYWWKEFDTYKVGTVANSCSTMHKIHAKEFTMGDFSTEHLMDWRAQADICDSTDVLDVYCYQTVLTNTIEALNNARAHYLETKRKPMKDESARKELMKKYWWQMIQLLPSSYNQRRTVMLNYEVLANIYKSRRHHKLDEWHTFCDWIESLPYSELITGNSEKKEETANGEA